jgi:predicted transcriptional regulator
MKKTSVYLSDGERDRLRELAEYEGKSQAVVLREALAAYEVRPRLPRQFAVDGSGASTDRRSAADIPEEELMRGFGDDSFGR